MAMGRPGVWLRAWSLSGTRLPMGTTAPAMASLLMVLLISLWITYSHVLWVEAMS